MFHHSSSQARNCLDLLLCGGVHGRKQGMVSTLSVHCAGATIYRKAELGVEACLLNSIANIEIRVEWFLRRLVFDEFNLLNCK